MTEAGGAKVELLISGPGGQRAIPLKGRVVVLGRQRDCDVVLDDDRVSRRHARLFLDPFGRWIVEDLGSRCGVWMAGQRVEAQAVGPGESFHIHPYSFRVREDLGRPVEANPLSLAASTIVEERMEEVAEAQTSGPLSLQRLKRLNELAAELSDLPSIAELYPQACLLLADGTGQVAAALRLSKALPEDAPPEVLAFHMAGRKAWSGGGINLHLSRRVLAAVRRTGRAVMAGGTVRAGGMDLTIVDKGAGREVFCLPLACDAESIEMLYLDMPGLGDPQGTFDYLQAATRQVASVRNSLILAKVRAEREGLDQQLSLARKMQARLVFHDTRSFEGVDLAVHYLPALWVGGDYCDVWRLDDGRLAFALGDVSGKGLPAAIAMANLQAALRTTMSFCQDPAQVLNHVQEHWQGCFPENIFVTLVLGLFRPADGSLQYVNAGHMPPLLVQPTGEVGPLGQPRNPPLGMLPTAFESCSARLQPGVALVAVTDGITEAMSPAGELFGSDRLQQALARSAVTSAEELVKRVCSEANAFRGNFPQQDDVTVLAMVRR